MIARSSAAIASATVGLPTAMPKILRAAGPTIVSKKRHVVRVLGTHVTLQEELRQRAESDLGIELQFSPGGSAQILHQAATQPESFDLYEQWSNSIRFLWQAGAIQPIEIDRIENWGEINSLTKTGRLTPQSRMGSGDAPHRILHVQPDQSLGANATRQVSFLPYVHNVDSFGYDAGQVERGVGFSISRWPPARKDWSSSTILET
jgi:putative spermidine/putrescine transport system substrate-binding protein